MHVGEVDDGSGAAPGRIDDDRLLGDSIPVIDDVGVSHCWRQKQHSERD